MSLPFLQPKKLSAVIIAKRKEGKPMEDVRAEDQHDPALMAAAEDLISAVHSKDATRVADALLAAFQVADMEPHVEGEHLEMEE